jgi:hypothetical protein
MDIPFKVIVVILFSAVVFDFDKQLHKIIAIDTVLLPEIHCVLNHA